MSKLETNTIDTISGSSTLQVGSTNTSTITLGASGDTINIPSGATINNNGTQTGFGGVNTPMVSARLSSNTNITDATFTKIEFDTEEIDTDSAYDSSTNYRFTVPSGKAGKYLIQGQVRGDGNNNDIRTVACHIYKNGTQQGGSVVQQVSNTGTAQSLTVPITQILDLSVSDYIEIFGFVDVASGTPFFNSADQRTRFLITKLIE